MLNIIDFVKGRKNFLMFFFLRIAVMALSFLTNIIIIRKLSVNAYGNFSVALMLVGLITTLGFSWSSSSILYYGGREKAETGSINKTFWSRNIIIAISLVITSTIFIFFREQINEYVGTDSSFLLLIWLYVSVAEDYLIQYFLAVKLQTISSLLSLTAKLIYLMLIITINFDVKTLIILNIISHSTVIFYVYGINKSDVGKFELDKEWFKEILNFSLWQFFGFSGLYLINFGDTAVIKYFMTTEDVGIYNAAYKVFNAVASFSHIISSYYAGSVSTYFTKRDYIGIRNFFYRERIILIVLSAILHVGLIIFSEPLILLMYGERYISAIPIFRVLMLGSMISYMSVFYVLYYNTNKKYKIQQFINILQAIVNVVLNIILIHYLGLIGPAIATVIAKTISYILSLLFCERKIKQASQSLTVIGK